MKRALILMVLLVAAVASTQTVHQGNQVRIAWDPGGATLPSDGISYEIFRAALANPTAPVPAPQDPTAHELLGAGVVTETFDTICLLGGYSAVGVRTVLNVTDDPVDQHSEIVWSSILGTPEPWVVQCVWPQDPPTNLRVTVVVTVTVGP